MQGLQKLRQEHDKGHVHLQLSFKRGLHPFYPPLLDVLYPRFTGPVAGALTSHPVTQLQHWDPWITQRELVAKLKAFLEVGLCVHACVISYLPCPLSFHLEALLMMLRGITFPY